MAPIPSTSVESTSTAAPRRRAHRLRPPSSDESLQSVIDLLNVNDTVIGNPPPHLRKNEFDERSRNSPYTTGLLTRNNQQIDTNSLAGVFVLIFVLIGIVIVLLLFYFLAKVCNAPESTGKRRLRTKDGKVIICDQHQEVEVVPTKVPLPKRIYELKAEEGYYSCPPTLDNSLNDIFGDTDEDFFSTPTKPQRSKSASEDKDNPSKEQQNVENCIRKLTAAGIPPNFKAKGRLQDLINSEK